MTDILHRRDRRTVKQDTLHKWVATAATIFAVTWGTMAYYVKSEDNQMKMQLQSQITILQVQQKTNEKVNEIVILIDKKLSNIEAGLEAQSSLIGEVKELRKEVNTLKLELARKG